MSRVSSKLFTLGLLFLFIAQGAVLHLLSTLNVEQMQTGYAYRSMPILTPVSLDDEREFSKGAKSIAIRDIVDRLSFVDPQKVSKEEIEAFQSQRQKMLSLRNHRHELNVRLMEEGIALLEVLNSEQWDWIQSQRDRLQAEQEQGDIEKILDKWGKNTD